MFCENSQVLPFRPAVDYVIAKKIQPRSTLKIWRQKKGAYESFTCKEFSQSTVFAKTHAFKTVQRIKELLVICFHSDWNKI